jgi:hypothetical protein
MKGEISMKKKIIWVHGDCLSPLSPSFQKYPDFPAVWVWDDALINEWELSLKRITFIYECLLELPVTIRRGDVATEILTFARENQADGVVTVESPSPRFGEIRDRVASELSLEILPLESFINYEGFIDLKRFSRYWRIAEKYVFENGSATSRF